MSEDLNNNERYLKEVADKHKPVPPPLVWYEIEQVLDKDKSKRRLYPILWIFGVLVMGAILFISLNHSSLSGKQSSIMIKSKVIQILRISGLLTQKLSMK